MKEFKGTPGPWVLVDGDDVLFETFSGVSIECPAKGVTVAIVGPYDYQTNYESDMSNAKLISAAPELLEALKLILSYHDDGNCVLHKEDVSMARAAINKALGE